MSEVIENNAQTVSLVSGGEFEIHIPVKVETGSVPNGAFFADTVTVDGVTYNLVQGFRVEDTTVGSIAAVDGKVAVKYTHLKDNSNRVFFHAIDGRVVTISIVNIPVHTHQSIAQGGPAYGTYFRDRSTT